MAFQHLRVAQSISFGDPLTKSVFLCIVTDIGVNGEPCWPSYRTIGNRTDMDKDTAGNRAKWLVQNGWLGGEKRGRGVQYTLGEWWDNGTYESTHPERDNGTIKNAELSRPEGDNGTKNDRLSQEITDRLSRVEAQLSLLVDRLSQSSGELSRPEGDVSSNRSRGMEAVGKHPPLPDPTSDDQDVLFKLHQDAIEFSRTWCRMNGGNLRHIVGDETIDREVNQDFIIPAATLIHRLGYEKAWGAVTQKRYEWLSHPTKDLSVRRLEPIVAQVIEDLNREQIKKQIAAEMSSTECDLEQYVFAGGNDGPAEDPDATDEISKYF